MGNTSYYSLLWVETDPTGNHTLQYESGLYNTSLASSLASHPFCRVNCSWDLPIQWDAPVTIANMGNSSIQGDALGAANSTIAVAYSTFGGTLVFESPAMGGPGTWVGVTGGASVQGTSPNITVQPCRGILLSTITSSNLIVTTFPLSCTLNPIEQTGVRRLGPTGPVPTVTSISPSTGPKAGGTAVTITGTNFTSYAGVTFGGKVNTSLTYVSTTKLISIAPAGSGVVDVIVTVAGVSSQATPADEFTYTGAKAWPTVTSVNPSAGVPGQVVTVTGTNFTTANNQLLVQFGTTPSSTVVDLSSTQLNATVPAGSGTVNVRVTTTFGTSNVTDKDRFTYETPAVKRVAPPFGYATALLTLIGANLSSGASVYFGTTKSPVVKWDSLSVLQAMIPWGNGTVNIRVINPGGLESPVVSNDFFTWVGIPIVGSRVTQSLPLALSARPVWTTSAPGINATMGVLAANASNSEVLFYHTNSPGGRLTAAPVGWFSTATGSAIFTSVGDTRIQTPGGAGAVAVANEGPVIAALFTTRSQNRTILISTTSSNFGLTWGQSFVATSLLGSVSSPNLASSPAGYFYGTWAENGAGRWQVDAQSFAPSGRPLLNATLLRGSEGPRGLGSQQPTVAVDGLQRALYVWTALNSSAESQIFATGDYLSPLHAASQVWSDLNSTRQADYLATATQGQVSSYESLLGGNISTFMGDWARGSTCLGEKELTGDIYPYVGRSLPLSYDNITTTCDIFHRPSPTALVANQSGVPTANLTLAVTTQWLMESIGFGVFSTPDWPSQIPQGVASAGVVFTTSNRAQDGSDYLLVQGAGINPKTALLDLGWQYDTEKQSSAVVAPFKCFSVQNPAAYTFQNIDAPLNFTTEVWVNSQTPTTYISNGSLLGVYLTNLSTSSSGTWSVQVTATYQQRFTEAVGCSPTTGRILVNRTTAIRSGWPTTVTLSTQGVYSTEFGYDPGTPLLNVSGPTNGPFVVGANWTNQLLAQSSVSLFDRTARVHDSPLPGYPLGNSSAEWFNFSNIPNNHTYTFWENSTSEPGLNSTSWGTTYDTGQYRPSVSALTASASCWFNLTSQPVALSWSNTGPISGVQASSAVVTWNATTNGVGWVKYKEYYGGWQYAAATEWKSGQNGPYPFSYRVDLSGLIPWGQYTVLFGVTTPSTSSTCLEFSQQSQVTFNTSAKFTVTEMDLPYDSVTQQGGGAVLYWMLPYYFVSHATFAGGIIEYYTSAAPSNVTEEPLTIPPVVAGCYWCYTTNLSGLTPNSTYVVNIDLNFSYGGTTIRGTGFPMTFWYQRDTSGDGLTDAEKVNGWEVTTQSASGSSSNTWVTADPAEWSTDGLISDFVEKEFGLNPRTVDTAGSHVVDTYNMTFDLGPSSANPMLPTGLNVRYWDERTTYNWTQACPYYLATSCSNFRLFPTRELTNLSDSYSWDAMVLWSGTGTGNALAKFITAPGVQNASWLRGTLGKYGPDWTLTLWGKLSWGANPLAASTQRNGVADGNLVNPLYASDLYLTAVTASLTHCPSESGSGLAGWALRFYVNESKKSGTPDIANFTVQGNDTSSGCGSISSYSAPLPVTDQSQNVSIQLSELINTGTLVSPKLGYERVWAGGAFETNISYDLVRGASLPFSNTTGWNGTVSFSLSTVPSGAKVTTFLWLPNDNGTLSTAPWGLKRYTGEQAFGLLVVNNPGSSTLTVNSIPFPTNATRFYSLSVAPGVTDFLVPRGELLNTTFGRAVLLGQNLSYHNASITPPFLNSTDQRTISGFKAANLITDLGCYWQNRSISTSGGSAATLCHTRAGGAWNESGVAAGAASEVTVTVANATGANVGGVASVPGLENSSDAGAALQSVITLNVSNATELGLLVAGLSINLTGGFNGSFLGVTPQIPLLGFNTVVTGGLTNRTITSSGLFGIPSGTVYTPPSGLLAALVNTAGGFLQVAGTILSHAWSLTVAGAQLIDNHLPPWLRAIGAVLAARVAASLNFYGAILELALQLLLLALQLAIKYIVTPLIQPIINAISSYGQTLTNDLNTLNGLGQITAAKDLQWWNNVSYGQSLLPILLGATVIIVGALFVAGTIAIGEQEISDIVISIIVSGAALAAGVLAIGLAPGLAGGFGSGLESAVSSGIQGFFANQGHGSCFSTQFSDFSLAFTIPADLLGATLSLLLFGAAVFNKAVPSPFKFGTDLLLSLLAVVFDVIGLIGDAAHNAAESFVGWFMSALMGAKSFYDMTQDIGMGDNKYVPGLGTAEVVADIIAMVDEGVAVAALLTDC